VDAPLPLGLAAEATPQARTRRTAELLERPPRISDFVEEQIRNYEVEIHKKYSIAMASLVFVIVGAPLALRFGGGGIGMVIATSMLIFSLYYIGLIGGESLAGRGDRDPVFAMWVRQRADAGAGRRSASRRWDARPPRRAPAPGTRSSSRSATRRTRRSPAAEDARMKLLDRYVLRQFLTTFFMLVLGLPLLFIIADITDNIDKYMDRGVGLGTWRWGTSTSSPSSWCTPSPSRRWWRRCSPSAG
jgi:hypothetical protein